MTVSTGVLREALKEVMDPCSIAVGRPQNLVDMGVIDEIECTDGDVTVQVVLTDPACFFFREISKYIRDILSAIPGVTDVRVEINTDKLWLPSGPHNAKLALDRRLGAADAR